MYHGAVIVLAACAVVVTGLLLRQELGIDTSATRAVRSARPVTGSAAADSLLRLGHVLGAENAEVRILEFSDFECPYCARARPALERLLEDYGDDVSIIYFHLPLDSQHPHARAAALASECAAAQERFESYHDLLFQRQDSLGLIDWTNLAQRAGVPDTANFRTCFESERLAGRLDAHKRLASYLGVQAAPTFVFADSMLSGYDAVHRVRSWIESRLSESD